MSKIILSADSTCDLSTALLERYDVHLQPLRINLGDKIYQDGVDITPDEIYETFKEERILPKTSAPNPQEYIDHFRQWTDEGHEVVHISLGSGVSSSYQNAKLASEELGNVYVIDSGNLSTGMGHLVVEAGERIKKGLSTSQIYEEVDALKSKVHASFVIDTLTYLYEGGRCSALQAFSASLLKIKPSIEVNNTNGKMDVGRKYRGSLTKAFKRYTKDQLTSHAKIKKDRVFITHSGTSQENIDIVEETIQELVDFDEVFITRAGCTISSHCGPNTLGVLFMTE